MPMPRTPTRSGSLSAYEPMGKFYAQTFLKLHLHVVSCKAIGPNADVPAGCTTIPVETCSHSFASATAEDCWAYFYRCTRELYRSQRQILGCGM